MDKPRSESNVTLRITEIQERFIELMQEEISELRLEDPVGEGLHDDPYNKAR